MAILADPIIRVLLSEFDDAVRQLGASTSHSPGDPQAGLEAVKQLCELSREIRFQLGPPKYADPDQVEEVAEAFESAVQTVQSLWTESASDGEMQDYCENILARARRCRD